MSQSKKEAYDTFKELPEKIIHTALDKLGSYEDMLDDEMTPSSWYMLGFSDARKGIGFKWRCAKTNPPPVFDGLGCSDCVLVIRDCGDGTLESYAVSRYRPNGWGHSDSQNCHEWLNQGVNGYRVTKWCELPPSESQEITY